MKPKASQRIAVEERMLLSTANAFYCRLFEFKCLLFYYYGCNIKLSFKWVNESERIGERKAAKEAKKKTSQ